jgi:hypothetical protein
MQLPVPNPEHQTIERPSNTYFLQEYELHIKFMARGCVVKVGCKEIPFESVEVAMEAVNEYVKNPYESQEFWRKELK